jgi:mannose/fructose/N-acetylgalactosamine-specific phosphotransferase system component IIC
MSANTYLAKFATDDRAETVLHVISGLAIGLAITMLILTNIFSATDTAMASTNDTAAQNGYASMKNYVWVGLPLLGVLIIVIVGRQLINNT